MAVKQLRYEADIELLAALVAAELGTDGQRWFTPDGYDGLALCVLDSTYSTGNRYSSVLRMLARYRESRLEEGGDPYSDGPSDVLSAADRWGGTDGFVAQTGHRWRVSTQPGAPFKAESALGAARVLQRAGLETVADVRDALTDRSRQEASPIKMGWIKLPRQRSGLTWTYFLMLAGVPGVKADRMVVRYVSRALGRETDARESASLVAAVADRSGVSQTMLDHAIWRKESGRAVFIDSEGESSVADSS